jgi:D-alanyl-lipoteichoic acid acyltransferase DltB (MBOAT superfamily)
MSLAIIVTVPMMWRLGIGKHVENIPIDHFLETRKLAWISQIFYFAAVGSIKCSIIALYHRLASLPPSACDSAMDRRRRLSAHTLFSYSNRIHVQSR